jgi:hypothetical protein
MQELVKVARVITIAAACLTVPLALMCAAVPLVFPHLLTADPAVATCMRSLALIAAASILACTMDVACEGLLVRMHACMLLIFTHSGDI